MLLYLPSVFAPASECSTRDAPLHSSILDSTGALSLTSSGKLLQPANLSRLWKRASYIRRLSGLTFAPSTLDAGLAAWIASLPVSPANLTPSPVSAQEPTTPAGSGPQSSTSFATLVHGSWCWKTSEDFFQAAEWVPYSQTFPASGSMSNGQCWERERWAPRIGGSGSLSSAPDWMTPDVPNGGRTLSPEAVAKKGATEKGKRQVGIANQVENWLTPHGMAGMDHAGKAGAGGEFAAMVERWPTPAARDHKGGIPIGQRDREQGTLDEAAEYKFSPQAQAIQDGPESSESPRGLPPHLGMNESGLIPVFANG